MEFRKSSFSQLTNCVEVRREGDAIEVRDSKHPDGAVLSFTEAEWAAFVAGVRDGQFDSLLTA